MNPRAARELVRLGQATVGECPDPCDGCDNTPTSLTLEDLADVDIDTGNRKRSLSRPGDGLVFYTGMWHRESRKITICHKPQGDEDDDDNGSGLPVTITISKKALPAHLAHGDTVGPCEVEECPAACDDVCPSACGDIGNGGGTNCTCPPGEDGADGQDGTNGIDGTNGSDGIDGEDGATGMPGINGTDGADGQDGSDGIDGTNGVDGTDGTNGIDGVDGQDGVCPSACGNFTGGTNCTCPPGEDGADGEECWDRNGNNVCDLKSPLLRRQDCYIECNCAILIPLPEHQRDVKNKITTKGPSLGDIILCIGCLNFCDAEAFTNNTFWEDSNEDGLCTAADCQGNCWDLNGNTHCDNESPENQLLDCLAWVPVNCRLTPIPAEWVVPCAQAASICENTVFVNEDINNDGFCTAEDCQGADGTNGIDGEDGATGMPGINGTDGEDGEDGDCSNCPPAGQENIKACCYINLNGSPLSDTTVFPLPFLSQLMWMARINCNPAPAGWATCSGQLLPISGNTALFSLMFTKYGGDGRSSFGLPNTQGMKGIVEMM